ncbi:MAG TPA: LiaF domain-containing protein [Streptosporangiaceae bacterium]
MADVERRAVVPEARASDAGRELAAVLRDLATAAGDAAPAAMREVGILAGFRRTGRWVVGRTFRGLAVIGSGEIDLRRARFADGETTIHATAIIGTITVVVPEDADVRIAGTGIVGGFDHRAEGPGAPGAPRVTVTGFALSGNVVVERRR